MQPIHLSCTALAGTGKVGIIPADENGYREVILGAIGVYNSAGEYYVDDDHVRSLFMEGSILQRRIAKGVCRSELGHPKKQPGMTDQEYMQRILSIEETNVSSHIREVRVGTSTMKDHKGHQVVPIYGIVKPSGPHMDHVEAQFANPDENVAYSIRSLTRNRRVGNTWHKQLRTVVNWDNVNEGGIDVANKYDSPALEDFSEENGFFLPNTLDGLETAPESFTASLESSGIDVTMLRTELGWAKVQKMEIPSHSW